VTSTDPHDLRWFKAAKSNSASGCVEVAHLPGGGVALRDSKDTSRPAFAFTATAWDNLIIHAKHGELDPRLD
jgi:hypothetical protein